MRHLMGNKCAPLMLLRLGDSDKVLSDVQELAEAVCAINCGFHCSRRILGLDPAGGTAVVGVDLLFSPTQN